VNLPASLPIAYSTGDNPFKCGVPLEAIVMVKPFNLGLYLCLALAANVLSDERAAKSAAEIPADALQDKIRGGLLGQILGNLNGLPHEMKYIHEPGSVKDYTPSLPQGARTDDDTDFEWVYIVAMQDENQILIPHRRVAELWQSSINQGIWCANLYARRLMDLGFQPPMTGSTTLNPWAEFNISGQFLCESFGLIAPGMPQTASKIGLHYTRVAIDDEPAQATQLFCTMIALAFVEGDINTLLDHGVSALDPSSRQRQIIADVRAWQRQNPHDWRTTRRLLKEKYSQADGGMRDRNGYELTTGSTIAALLYGGGDLPETLKTAFNFGWDADNTAATAGAIVGVLRGYRSLMSQGWQIVDRYRNTTREGMPMDETITSYADRLIELSEKVIRQGGGERVVVRGRPVYRIAAENARNVHPLRLAENDREKFREELIKELLAGIHDTSDPQKRARAVYLAICLDVAPALEREQPDSWRSAVGALNKYQELVAYLFSDQPDTPAHLSLKERARAAGVVIPKK
jgi:hypothetical protein